MKLFRFFLVGSFFAVSTATAQTAPSDKSQFNLFNPVPADQMRGMATDRPNKTNTPTTVDAGHVQIETGAVDYTYDRIKYQGTNARADSWDVGEFNFRVGVLNNLELNLAVNSYDFLRIEDYASHQTSRQNGLGDTVIGATFNLWGNEISDDVWATAFGIQPQFKIPTARESIGNGHPEYFLGLPFFMNLPAGFHLSVEPAFAWLRNSAGTGDVSGVQNAVSIDRIVFEKLDVYLEYSIQSTREHHAESQQTLDTGAVYQLTDNLSIDTGFNIGLDRATPNLEWVAGISVRF